MIFSLLIFTMCWIVTCSLGMLILLLMRIEERMDLALEIVNRSLTTSDDE